MALRFISGKYQGGEYPLTEGQEIVIGRSSELDMVLVEEMVSRRHARIQLNNGVITIEDLGSTNGTFINGEKIQRATLKESDRILIGTSILKVVATAERGESPEAQAQARDNARQNMRQAGEDAPRMSGSLEEIPLPDLLQLFGTSRKDGVLILRIEGSSGRILLKGGLIAHAEIDDKPTINGRKAAYRMLGWAKGVFELEPPDPREIAQPMDANAQEILMEGFRRQDELGEVMNRLPPLTSRLAMASPLRGSLRQLSPEELDLLDLAVNSPNIQAVLDTTPEHDLETAQRIEGLIKRGYLVAAG